MSYVVRRIALTPPDRPLTFLTQYLNSSPFKMVRYQTSLLLTKLYQSFRSVTEILRGADNKIAKKGLELSVCILETVGGIKLQLYTYYISFI